MVKRNILIFMATFIIILVSSAILSVAQLSSEEKAKARFESLGCAGCHNGSVAPTWDEIVALIRE